MATAVCIKCGEIKPGAWIKCDSCGFKPKTIEDKTKNLLLTTHYMKLEQLEVYSQHLKENKEVGFEQALLDRVMPVIMQKEEERKQQKIWFYKVFGTILLIPIIILLFFVFK